MIFIKTFFHHSFATVLLLTLLIGCGAVSSAHTKRELEQAGLRDEKRDQKRDASPARQRSTAKPSLDSLSEAHSNRADQKLTRTARANSATRDPQTQPLSKRQRLDLDRAEAQRLVDAKRIAAKARQQSTDSLRDDVQSMIAKDDLSGEDSEVRRVAINALGAHAGTVVVMNPKTGRVYSMVNQEWAVHEGFKPCSTIKLVTGLAGLNEQVIDPEDTANISDGNKVSLTKALAYSKNDYFQQVGGQLGFEKLLSYARQLGLGEKTGINLRNEFAGTIPNSKTPPGIARMSSHGDAFQITPLQLATLVSAIGNGGKLVTPFVVRSRQDEVKLHTKVRRTISFDSETWRTMIPGMVGSVNYGSGKKAHDPAQTVAGKTGTCIDRGEWVGLFTSYSPLANPTLAVVVITRGADAQNHLPAAVAGRIYRDLNNRFGATANVRMASQPKHTLTMHELAADQVAETAATGRFSKEDRAVMANQTHLPSVRPFAREQVRPALMQVQDSVVEPSSTETPIKLPVSSDGQTRPRRVYLR